MEYVKCNLCNSDDYYVWGEKNNITIVTCKRCGLLYCNPRPEKDELQKFYNEDYFIEGDYEGDSKRQKMYELEIEEILKTIGTKGRFLDVGCAVGKFLVTLPDTFEKWGTEFSDDAAGIGRKKFHLNIITGQIKDIKLSEAYFDIIQMRGVLEHCQDPSGDLVTMRKFLKDDGILRISQLPNIKSICAKIFKTRFNQVKPGEHLYYFSPKTIQALLYKAGFKIVSLSFPYLFTPYASLFKDIFHVMTFFYGQKESPPFFGNMMVIYAKKREFV